MAHQDTEQCLKMIQSFERAHFEKLLDEFDGGVTSVLVKRVVDMINNPTGIDRQKFMKKISSLYDNIQHLKTKPSRPGLPLMMNLPTVSSSNGINIKFKDSPFYELVDEILQPKILVGHDISHSTNGTQSMSFKYHMAIRHINMITLNQDVSKNPPVYPYQIHIRIGVLEKITANKLTDHLPTGLNISINNVFIVLPPFVSKFRQGPRSRRVPIHIELTNYLKLNPNLFNIMSLNWFPDDQPYYMGIHIVRHCSSRELLQRLYEKESRSIEETKSDIVNEFKVHDSDLATTNIRISLLCPLNKVRMATPVRSVKCQHLQCFDANAFIMMNENKQTWTCPICTQPILYEDLQIHSYFTDVMSDRSLPADENEIELFANGDWKRSGQPSSELQYQQQTSADCVSLCDDDDDEGDNRNDGGQQKPAPVASDGKMRAVDDHSRDRPNDEKRNNSRREHL